MARMAKTSPHTSGKDIAGAKRSWFRRHPLASGLLVVGVAAALSTYLLVSKPWSGMKPGEKKGAGEVNVMGGAEKRRAEKWETLQRILKLRKEFRRRGLLEVEEVNLPPISVFDLEKMFESSVEGFSKDRLVSLFKMQEQIVSDLEEEYAESTEGMYIDKRSGEAFGSSLEKETEMKLRFKLMEAKARWNVLKAKVEEIELAESGLLEKNKLELESLLLQTEGWGTQPVDYYPWEFGYERHLILKAIYLIDG